VRSGCTPGSSPHPSSSSGHTHRHSASHPLFSVGECGFHFLPTPVLDSKGCTVSLKPLSDPAAPPSSSSSTSQGAFDVLYGNLDTLRASVFNSTLDSLHSTQPTLYLTSDSRDSAGAVSSNAQATESYGCMRQKKSLLEAYFNVGKFLNQSLREGLPLNQSFSSPLLISYLLHGREGLLRPPPNLSHSQLIQGILDHDSGYAGALP
jgi:hypothetical protein